ncbi:MAG: PKD domain-containing protein, partial [bacterium]
LYQFAITSNKTSYVTGASAVILMKEAPMNVDFSADETEICAGGTVNFTDNSSQAVTWEWTFEGGTPSTSLEQNPSVTYEEPGTYDVELTITNGETEMTELKNDYIIVQETPEQANAPEGDEEVCTGNIYLYTCDEVDYAANYEWELSPEEAGTLTWDLNEAQLETPSEWTGDFTLRVRASNDCGTGAWSELFYGAIVSSPEDYVVEGGGSYCLGGDGVEITLNGSDTGVDYELFLDSDPTGNVVEGTGSEISFGLQTDEGYYSVMASNDNCEQNMTGQVQVVVEYPPLEPGIPEGPQVICSEESSDYSSGGTEDAETYTWTLSPEDAGTLTFDGLDASVVWNTGFTGMAYLSLFGTNACGDGNPSEALEVSVEGTPIPEVDGESLACDFSTEVYAVEEHEGSLYTWSVTGGDITEGQDTYSITVAWGGVGTGTVEVTEETVNGCVGSSETFTVTIDDCTGMNEKILQGEVKLYPNPAEEQINLGLSLSDGSVVHVRIFNIMGQLEHDEQVNGKSNLQVIPFSIVSYSPGLHFIKVTSENQVIWQGGFIKR